MTSRPVAGKIVARPSKRTLMFEVARKHAVVYSRVSSKEQEKEGFSIPAQLKLLKDYAASQGFAVAKEYVDVETAKQTGRTAFGEMIAHLKAQSSIRILLVEKTDRLYRNLKDWVTVDDLEVEIHFVKEGVVLSRGSRSSEKFMHGIKVLMDGEMVATFRQPFDLLAETTANAMRSAADDSVNSAKSEIWLPKSVPNGSYAKGLFGFFEHLRMGDALTFAEQSCRSGPRLEFGDVYAIDCERISQKFSHDGFGETTRHGYWHPSRREARRS
jgi:hypothetical protein